MKPIRKLLDELKNCADKEAAILQHSYAGLMDEEKNLYKLKKYDVYQGKVRELVKKNNELFIFHTDRLSAFDRHIGMIPYKGAILAQVSEFWLREATRVVPTHLLSSPHNRVLQVQALSPIKVEVIVRGYMTGSMERSYLKGERNFCGTKLPEGLTASCKLSQSIITPTSKAEVYEHDEDTTPAELIKQGVVTDKEWAQIESMSFKLFEHGQKVYLEKGWILVDTKYEFGRDKNNTIKVIDEVHTPDSSRLWIADSYEERFQKGLMPEMLDKEIIRKYLMEQGFQGEGEVPQVPADMKIALAEVYLAVAESITGKTLISEGPISGSAYLIA